MDSDFPDSTFIKSEVAEDWRQGEDNLIKITPGDEQKYDSSDFGHLSTSSNDYLDIKDHEQIPVEVKLEVDESDISNDGENYEDYIEVGHPGHNLNNFPGGSIAKDPLGDSPSKPTIKGNPGKAAKSATATTRRKKRRPAPGSNCLFCHKILLDKAHLFIHLRGHLREKPFHCPMCEEEFASNYEMAKHIKYKHLDYVPPDKPKRACDICGKVVVNIWQHVNFVHGPRRFSECGICGKKLAGRGALTVHQRVHKNERNFSCDICGRRFKDFSTLKQHKLTHSEPKARVECDICGKMVVDLSSHKRYLHMIPS